MERIFLLSKCQRLPEGVSNCQIHWPCHNVPKLWGSFSNRHQSIFVLGSKFPWRSLDWCGDIMNLGFVKMARPTDPHTTFVIFIPATVSTIFKTRTHQLMWRMAERKSFFCAGEDSCVFISQLSSSSSPPCVCLLVERVTQQPSQEDVRILRMSNWEFPSSQSGFASYH